LCRTLGAPALALLSTPNPAPQQRATCRNELFGHSVLLAAKEIVLGMQHVPQDRAAERLCTSLSYGLKGA
jgi:hypothetical protein